MIIGLSSRIGGGKDTVAKMIQYYFATNFCIKEKIRTPFSLNDLLLNNQGQMCFLPTKNANFSYDFLQIGGNWKIKKYAGTLKAIASIMTGIPVEKFEDQDFKKTYLGKEWNVYKLYHEALNYEEEKMTVREFLQRLGTDAVRKGLHDNAWVNSLFATYKDGDNWLVSDMRFPNEFDGIKERGGITVRIVRGDIELNDPTLHTSETALDSHFINGKFDYTIQNNGTLEDLEKEVIKMLNHFNLI